MKTLARLTIVLSYLGVQLVLGVSPALAAAAPAAPVNVRAFTGGNDIAVLWNPAVGTTPKNYTVYRNGNSVATVAATAAGAYVNTDRYIDTNVVAGRTYTYQIKTTSTTGAVSALSASVGATQPAARATTAVPTVTVSTSANDLKSALNAGKSAIQTWYSKFADILARPNYTPPTSITLTSAPNTGYAAYTTGTTITVDEGWLRANLSSPAPNVTGLFLHEMTHILQNYSTAPSWVTEGLAVWATHNIYNDGNTPFPGARSYYTDGYDNASYLIEWTAKAYNLPTLARDLNLTAHAGTYTDGFFVSRTGKTPHDLWAQMTGVNVQSMKFVGTSTLCVDVPWAINTDGSQLQIGGCWNTSAQSFTVYPNPNGSGSGEFVIMSKCLDARNSGTADGTAVQLYTCNSSAAQQWIYQTNGTLLNPNSGKCVQPAGGSNVAGALLEIDACNGSAAQQWTKQLL